MHELGTRDYIEGMFVKELNNRFLCEVEINGEVEQCYVPSSCKLKNFLDLSGKKVILVPTASRKSRTKYALFALPFKRNYIVLNPSLANRAIEDCIQSRRFSFLGSRRKVQKEQIIANYKCDLFIQDTNTIVEIKSVISDKSTAQFPTVYSERSLNQLNHIKGLLQNNIKVFYCIVSLNPYVKEINLVTSTEFYSEIIDCIDAGLTLKGYSVRIIGGEVVINKEIPIKGVEVNNES